MNLVSDYREKILAVTRVAPLLKAHNVTSHVIVPAVSVADGVLVEESVCAVKGAGLYDVSMPKDAQVRAGMADSLASRTFSSTARGLHVLHSW